MTLRIILVCEKKRDVGLCVCISFSVLFFFKVLLNGQATGEAIVERKREKYKQRICLKVETKEKKKERNYMQTGHIHKHVD